MKQASLLTVVLLALLSLQGCATRNYGRQEALGEQEKMSMTCQDIDQEMTKVVEFVDRLHQIKPRRDSAILNTMEEYWIGNSREKLAATESANSRMTQLWTLRDLKKCHTSGGTDSRSLLETPATKTESSPQPKAESPAQQAE